MSECIGTHDCTKCGRTTTHIFSGSCRKGVCEMCGTHLPEEERPDTIISYDG